MMDLPVFTIPSGLRHMLTLYGDRNAVRHPDRRDFLVYAGHSVKMLADASRKEWGKEEEGRALTAVVGWTCAFVNSFPRLPVAEVMAFKYGSDICSYCKQKKCSCLPDRPPLEDAFVFSEWVGHPSTQWSLSDWQKAQVAKYGHANKTAGVVATISRLLQEVSELTVISPDLEPYCRMTVGKLLTNYAEEAGDVFIWSMAVAELLEIDLGQAMVRRYGMRCDACDKLPCVCGALVLERATYPLTCRQKIVTVSRGE